MTTRDTTIRSGHPDRARPGARRAGFSIIELVIVVSVILVMTSIIAPTFRLTPTRQVENMAQVMVAHLELARSHALGNRQAVRVDFDVSGRTYTAYTDHDEDGTISAVADEIAAFPAFGVRSLTDRIVFARGSAAALPGDAGAGAVTLASDRLTMDDQAIPSPWGTMGTIYLTHGRDDTAVAAISVASSGAFRAWRWWPDAGEWR